MEGMTTLGLRASARIRFIPANTIWIPGLSGSLPFLLSFAAAVIAYAGSRLSKIADQLADITGMGEAMFGAVFLGGCTSLPGIVTSVASAYQGYAEISISNAIGGIAAQTAFLAIADISTGRPTSNMPPPRLRIYSRGPC